MGRIAGPFGVQGWVKVFPYTEDVESLLDYPVWWLRKDEAVEEWHEVKVTECRLHGKLLAAALEQCTDRTAALGLKGMQVAIPRSQLPKLPKSGKDGYYWADLIGLNVKNQQNIDFGKIADVFATGANDVVVAKSENGQERLIPYIAQVILEVDLNAKTMLVDWDADF